MRRIDHIIEYSSRMFGKFWQWWIGELILTVPDRFRHALSKPRSKLIWRASNGQFENGGSMVGYEPGFAGRSAVLDLSGLSHRYEVANLRVGRSQLKNALELQLDRLIPWPPAEVWFDCSPIPNDPDKVEIVVVPYAEIEKSVRTVRELGLSPSRGVIKGTSVDIQYRVPLTKVDISIQSFVSLPNVLALATVLLFAGLVISINDRRAQDLTTLRTLTSEARQDAFAVGELRRELALGSERDAFLVSKASNWPVLDLVASLSEQLPDEVWLQDLTIVGSSISLEGNAPDAASIVRTLEEQLGFVDVRQDELNGAAQRRSSGQQTSSFVITASTGAAGIVANPEVSTLGADQ